MDSEMNELKDIVNKLSKIFDDGYVGVSFDYTIHSTKNESFDYTLHIQEINVCKSFQSLERLTEYTNFVLFNWHELKFPDYKCKGEYCSCTKKGV